MARLYDLARMNTATTGTGNITLSSAVTGFLTFALAGAKDGDEVGYGISDTNATEIGRGIVGGSGTTLTRSVIRSSNSNSPISLSGTAQVFITPSAQDFVVSSAPNKPGVSLTKHGNKAVLNTAPHDFNLRDVPFAKTIDGDLQMQRGNIVFTSPGARIRGDMSSPTALSNRLAFQTTWPDASTGLYIIPNGSSTSAILNVCSDSAITNGNVGQFQITGSELRITNVPIGTGSAGNTTFYSNTTQMLVLNAGAVSVSAALFQVASTAGTPVFYMNNLTSATDAKVWRHYTINNDLFWDVVNDAVSVQGTNWLKVTRSTTTITTINHNVATSGIHTWSVNASEKMRLDASGNLVIGATSAFNTLDVVGGFCVRGGTSTSYSTGTTNPTISIFFDVANNAGNIYSIAAGVAWKPLNIQFSTLLLQASAAPVNAIFVDAAGNVSIGTATTVSGYTNFATNIQGAGNITLTAVNAGMEIGAIASSNTPFIDFHSSGGSARDYDVRIIASGGNTSVDGQGQLTFNAAGGVFCSAAFNTTALVMNTAVPLIEYVTSGSALNAKVWRMLSTGNTFIFDITDDAITAEGGVVFTVTRSANSLTNIVFGTAVNVTGVTNLTSTTATPAGGSTSARLLFGTTAGFGIYYGSGAPTVSAAQGSLYLRSDGIAGARFYINNNGSTGWTAEG